MASTEEFLNIDTPENVAFGYEVVGIGSRFIAGMIDSAIVGTILLILTIVGFAVFQDVDEEGSTILVAIGLFLGFAILWGYYIFFEMTWNGRSPGKKAANLRVIKRDGTPITLSESIIRNLIRTIDVMPSFYGVGIVSMFIDNQSRRLGDIMAGTLVVRDSEELTLHNLTNRELRTLRAPGKAEYQTRDWPVHLLSADDIRLAENFLSRRSEINQPNQLAYNIARRLMKKMDVSAAETVFLSDAIYILNGIVQKYYREHSS